MSTAKISDKWTCGDEKSPGKNIKFTTTIATLCTTAKKGLATCYGDSTNPLPYTSKLHPNATVQPEGYSIRYAAISQIGIGAWLKSHRDDKASLPNLWTRIIDNYHKITHCGDFALALWAAAVGNAEHCELFAKALSNNWQSQKNLCNVVELGWIVQSCTAALAEHTELEPYLRPVLNEAIPRLVLLYQPQQRLFRRHNRTGLKEIISSRIASFADQVYPILALANYGRLFADKQSIEIAGNVAEQICRLQGPLGQWWWHYDTGSGEVSEEYPVFSVHQDSMAPMAIMASDKATGENHLGEIERGIRWLLGNNELHTNLLLDEAGIIWRDIEKREPAKLSRSIRALFCVSGLHSLNKLVGKCFIGFRINYECRPYHLGWILYAWAGYRAGNQLDP
jgi:hypothetical protein